MSLGIMMPTDINPYQTGQSSIPTAILYQMAIIIHYNKHASLVFAGIAKSYQVLPIGRPLWRQLHQ